MLKKSLFLFVAAVFALIVNAQIPEDIVFTVNGSSVSLEEFKYIYEKNNSIAKDEKLYTKESLDEYLDLYIKFKLKVQEAKSLGLDTTDKFIKEFNTYRNQLAQPYLKDKEVSEKLVEEAYERMQFELRASHILIDVAEDAYPKDTLKAYTLAVEALNKVKAGADFAEVAKEYSQYTKDVTLEQRGGDLGFFTAFNMIYPFESACYTSEMNSAVGPVRTRFGYHVIMVTDKRPYLGEMTASHIMIRTDLDGAEGEKIAKGKIDSIYLRLQKGEKFENLARTESQHFSSASQGGRLRPFNRLSSWLPMGIIDQAYALENNEDFSKPFETEYGWHIVKRLSLESLKGYDEMKEVLKKKVERDTRSQRSTKAALNRIKTENNFKEYSKSINDFKNDYDSLILKGTWVKSDKEKYKKKMFLIGKQKVLQADFANWLLTNQTKGQFQNAEYAMDYMYGQFVEETVFDYEDSRLEIKYSEFKNIVREYYEGILLFEITDDEVWTKAMKDTVGQREFFSQNRDDYVWGERADVLVFYCNDKSVADEIKSKLSNDNANLNDLYKAMNEDNSMTFSYTKDLIEKGDKEVVDMVEWSEGYHAIEDFKGRYTLVKINEIRASEYKKLNEIKGLVIADYQSFLEQNWISGLMKKYDVEVNQQLVDSLIKE
ncbi:MAG: peptidylprolyl isomerase [Bacteroidia bacterium]